MHIHYINKAFDCRNRVCQYPHFSEKCLVYLLFLEGYLLFWYRVISYFYKSRSPGLFDGLVFPCTLSYYVPFQVSAPFLTHACYCVLVSMYYFYMFRKRQKCIYYDNVQETCSLPLQAGQDRRISQFRLWRVSAD